MREEILDSVINITKTRDIDSLESSLASTLFEFIQCHEIEIFGESGQAGEDAIERRLHARRTKDTLDVNYNHVLMNDISEGLQECLALGKEVYESLGDGKERCFFPIIINGEAVGAVCITSAPINALEMRVISALCRIYENYLNILNENERDPLTGLLNRQTFERKLQALMQRQLVDHTKNAADQTRVNHRLPKTNESSWLVIIDIDFFKRVNDVHGHVCGDEVLLKLSQLMSSFFRETDLLFRFGGEEFVIVFEPLSLTEINKKLNAFMDEVRATRFPFVDKLTVSMGFDKLAPNDFLISVVERADKALYAAKNNGRDQFWFYGDLAPMTETKVNDGGIDLF